MTDPQPYQPPAWTGGLKEPPVTRWKLAQLPTPIEDWEPPGIPQGFKTAIKRDDLTGVGLSVCNDAAYFYRELDRILSELGAPIHADQILTI